MGAFFFIAPRIERLLPPAARLKYVGRRATAAPATGITRFHKKEHADILKLLKSVGDLNS